MHLAKRYVAASLALLAVSVVPVPWEGAKAWNLKSDRDPQGGMNCSMTSHADDGSVLSVFVNQDAIIGFLLHDPIWNIPQDYSSHVSFHFDKVEFTMPVRSFDKDLVGGIFNSDELEIFFVSFVEKWKMQVVFPNGDSWDVSLRGSSNAFEEWLICARAITRDTYNPFSRGAATNPF